MSPAPALFLAVDCGGSKTAAAIADASGMVIGRGTGGPSNITYLSSSAFIRAVEQAVNDALAAALAATSSDPSTTSTSTLTVSNAFTAAWLGISGADSPLAIARILPPLAALLGLPAGSPRLAVANDTALLAAPLRMHADVRHAVALIAGTGSIAVAFTRAEGGGEGAPVERGRAGGWGWILGDEGGGFALGRLALRAVLRAYDAGGDALARGPLVDGVLAHYGAQSVMEVLTGVYAGDDAGNESTTLRLPREKRISTLAPLVFSAAFSLHDPLALSVVQDGARELAEQTAGMLASTGGDVCAEDSALCLGGSLVGVEAYRALVIADLARRGHVFKRVVYVDDPAALGASGLAAAFGRAGVV